MSPAVPDRHTGTTGGLHPVQTGAGQDPRSRDRPGQAPQEARPSCGGQGLQQQNHPRYSRGRAGARTTRSSPPLWTRSTHSAQPVGRLAPASARSQPTRRTDRDTCAQVRHGTPAPIQQTRESGATGSRCDEGHVLPPDNRTRGSGNVGDADSRVHIPFPLTHGVQRWPTPVSAKLSKLCSSSPNPVSNRTRCSTVSTRLPHAPQRRRSARPGRVRGDGRRHPNAGHGGTVTVLDKLSDGSSYGERHVFQITLTDGSTLHRDYGDEPLLDTPDSPPPPPTEAPPRDSPGWVRHETPGTQPTRS